MVSANNMTEEEELVDPSVRRQLKLCECLSYSDIFKGKLISLWLIFLYNIILKLLVGLELTVGMKIF